MDSRLRFSEGKQKELLTNFVSLSGGNVRDVCASMKIPRWTFRNWMRETRLLPESVYDKIVASCPSLAKFEKYILERKPAGWGRVLGGRRSILSIKRKYGEAELERRRSKGGRSSIELRWEEIRKRMPSKDSHELFELLGAMMGDGWIGVYGGRKQINLCGCLVDEKEYKEHLRRIVKLLFGVSPYAKDRPAAGAFYLVVSNSVIFDFFREKFDFPVGDKAFFNTALLPKSWEYQKDVIRGIFDTDGSIYFDKSDKYKFIYPTIDIASKNAELIAWVAETLRNNGFPVFTGKRRVRLKGRENVERWFNEIKPSNQKHWTRFGRRHSTGPVCQSNFGREAQPG